MAGISKSWVTGADERIEAGIAAVRLFGKSVEAAQAARIGRFSVLRHLGRGGMGVVFSAYDEELDRRVAIKLLRSAHSRSSEARVRMLREAQAMARLSHPNVAQIHEVGEYDGQVFIAMEYVHGQTLRSWSQVGGRGWREILDMFLQAGRGLAAAHHKGLVHRDFKPENVLVGDDGRPRVVDFGLASADDAVGAGERELGERTASAWASEALDTAPPRGEVAPPSPRLTRTGTVLGTPAYMAPEQHLGRIADARSDQFSFCVALFEALHGARPFVSDGQEADADWLARVCRGDVSPPPRDSGVPRRVHQALVRGLTADPTARWSGMEALLLELSREHEGRRWRWWTAASVALTIGAGGSLAYQAVASENALCQESESRLAGVWDDDRKDALRATFVATPRPHAAATWERAAAVLDTYAAGWATMHRESCEATHVRGEQSDAALDLRTACLERRRRDLQALTDVFAGADAQIVDNAIQAAQSLPSFVPCADVEALKTVVRPPEEPARRATVERLRAGVAEAWALHEAGKPREGLAFIEPLIAEIEAVDHPPLTAESMYNLGRLQEKFDSEAAETALFAAIRAGALGKDDLVVAQALTRLIYVVGGLRHQYEAGFALGRTADAAVLRTGDLPVERADLDNNLGIVWFYKGDFEAALAHHQRALDARIAAYGREHPVVSKSLNNLGATLTKLARFDEAAARQEEGIAIVERSLGPEHPSLAMSLLNLGIVRDKQGRFLEAREHYLRALEIQERSFGPEHPEVAAALTNLGIVEQHLDRHDQAAEYLERALHLKERAHGPDEIEVSHALNSLATTRVQQGRLAEGRELLERVVAIDERVSGPDQPEMTAALHNLADLDVLDGDLAGARIKYQRALAIRERTFGPNHPDVALVLLGLSALDLREHDAKRALVDAERALAIYEAASKPPPVDLPWALIAVAEARLALGRPADAEAPLTRALTQLGSREATAAELADANFPLARAIWGHGGSQRERAVGLAREARAAYATVAPRRDESLRAVDAWLAERSDGGVR